MQDTLGEFQLGVWLAGESATSTPDRRGGSGGLQSGAEIGSALYEGPDGGWAVVVHTTWRSATGAQSFSDAATQRMAALGGQYRVCGSASAVDVAIASSEALVPDFIDCNTMG